MTQHVGGTIAAIDGPCSHRTPWDRVRTPAALAALVAFVALAGWEGTQHFATPAARWSVGATIVLAVAATIALGAGRQRQSSRAWLASALHPAPPSRRYAVGVGIWVLLLALVFAWDLFSFLRQSADLPTLSYLFGRVTRFRPGRSALFLAWLATGAYIALGWRAAASRPRRP